MHCFIQCISNDDNLKNHLNTICLLFTKTILKPPVFKLFYSAEEGT